MNIIIVATTKMFVSISLFVTIVAIFEAQALIAASSQTHFSKFSRAGGVEVHDFYQSVKSSMVQAQMARDRAYDVVAVSHRRVDQTLTAGGVSDCAELLDDSLDQLGKVVDGGGDHDDVHTWLSAALTNQDTCLQSLSEDKRYTSMSVGEAARNLSRSITDSLALFVKSKKSKSGGAGRKLLSGDFPAWVSGEERRLLEAPVEELGARLVVAKDGSGTHKTIGEALEMAVSLAGEGGGGGGKTVIHITAGTYHENIDIPTKRKNVMLVGDGKGKSVIVASRSNEGGFSTYKTATVAGMGDGFIARDLTIVNNAGPDKHQAVALRVGADRSVIYRCSIDGYQDSLYAHSKRQFYRETDIHGTVDFIFGNAAAVFQSCYIHARRPASSDHLNFVTAHGRTDPNQNTGFSIHSSRIEAAESGRRTYLGRPWKQYARVVVMESFIDGGIHPAGWSPWSGSFALKTLFYGEYKNTGPGSGISGRVNWPSYHGAMSSTEAQSYTVSGLISGNQWIPSTGVAFNSGLMG